MFTRFFFVSFFAVSCCRDPLMERSIALSQKRTRGAAGDKRNEKGKTQRMSVVIPQVPRTRPRSSSQRDGTPQLPSISDVSSQILVMSPNPKPCSTADFVVERRREKRLPASVETQTEEESAIGERNDVTPSRRQSVATAATTTQDHATSPMLDIVPFDADEDCDGDEKGEEGALQSPEARVPLQERIDRCRHDKPPPAQQAPPPPPLPPVYVVRRERSEPSRGNPVSDVEAPQLVSWLTVVDAPPRQTVVDRASLVNDYSCEFAEAKNQHVDFLLEENQRPVTDSQPWEERRSRSRRSPSWEAATPVVPVRRASSAQPVRPLSPFTSGADVTIAPQHCVPWSPQIPTTSFCMLPPPPSLDYGHIGAAGKPEAGSSFVSSGSSLQSCSTLHNTSSSTAVTGSSSVYTTVNLFPTKARVSMETIQQMQQQQRVCSRPRDEPSDLVETPTNTPRGTPTVFCQPVFASNSSTSNKPPLPPQPKSRLTDSDKFGKEYHLYEGGDDNDDSSSAFHEISADRIQSVISDSFSAPTSAAGPQRQSNLSDQTMLNGNGGEGSADHVHETSCDCDVEEMDDRTELRSAPIKDQSEMNDLDDEVSMMVEEATVAVPPPAAPTPRRPGLTSVTDSMALRVNSGLNQGDILARVFDIANLSPQKTEPQTCELISAHNNSGDNDKSINNCDLTTMGACGSDRPVPSVDSTLGTAPVAASDNLSDLSIAAVDKATPSLSNWQVSLQALGKESACREESPTVAEPSPQQHSFSDFLTARSLSINSSTVPVARGSSSMSSGITAPADQLSKRSLSSIMEDIVPIPSGASIQDAPPVQLSSAAAHVKRRDIGSRSVGPRNSEERELLTLEMERQRVSAEAALIEAQLREMEAEQFRSHSKSEFMLEPAWGKTLPVVTRPVVSSPPAAAPAHRWQPLSSSTRRQYESSPSPLPKPVGAVQQGTLVAGPSIRSSSFQSVADGNDLKYFTVAAPSPSMGREKSCTSLRDLLDKAVGCPGRSQQRALSRDNSVSALQQLAVNATPPLETPVAAAAAAAAAAGPLRTLSHDEQPTPRMSPLSDTSAGRRAPSLQPHHLLPFSMRRATGELSVGSTVSSSTSSGGVSQRSDVTPPHQQLQTRRRAEDTLAVVCKSVRPFSRQLLSQLIRKDEKTNGRVTLEDCAAAMNDVFAKHVGAHRQMPLHGSDILDILHRTGEATKSVSQDGVAYAALVSSILEISAEDSL